MGHGWPALGRQDAAARVHGRRWVAHAERASKGGLPPLPARFSAFAQMGSSCHRLQPVAILDAAQEAALP